jgi:hypothetical protein
MPPMMTDTERRMRENATRLWNHLKETYGYGQIAIGPHTVIQGVIEYGTTINLMFEMGYLTKSSPGPNSDWSFINQYPVYPKPAKVERPFEINILHPSPTVGDE